MQSASSPSSHDNHRSTRKPSRHSSPGITSATLTPKSEERRRGRERAKTDVQLVRSTANAQDDLPLTTTPVALKATQPSPLHLGLASAEKSSKPKRPTVITHTSSAPIPIPIPPSKGDFDCPITPLSARGDGKPSHHLGRSLQPKYMRSPDNSRHVNYFSDSSDSSAISASQTQRDTPASPRSPSMPLSQRFPRAGHPSPPPNALRLPSLPRFHPANYESPKLEATANTSRATRPAAHGRQYSDAQQKIHKYQRDIVTNATRTARLTLSPKATESPRSPRLNPMGSPGPVTPFALESEGDYLMARNTGSPASKKNHGRDMVERLLQKENERRLHPQRADSTSPAVSPAGGPH